MRLTELQERDLNPEQVGVLEAVRSGPRSTQHGAIGLTGPFGVWVRAPKMGDATQALGAAVRYESSLPENVKEVAICTVGAFYRAKFEFVSHAALAVRAGVNAAAVESLRVGGVPDFKGREAISHRVASALIHQHGLDDATYADAVAEFGEVGLIELVGTVGYYCMVSLTLNAFDVPLPDGASDPFPAS